MSDVLREKLAERLRVAASLVDPKLGEPNTKGLMIEAADEIERLNAYAAKALNTVHRLVDEKLAPFREAKDKAFREGLEKFVAEFNQTD